VRPLYEKDHTPFDREARAALNVRANAFRRLGGARNKRFVEKQTGFFVSESRS
jgi:hypothetical protein